MRLPCGEKPALESWPLLNLPAIMMPFVESVSQRQSTRAPVGDAVVKLRAMIVAGTYPGVTKQSELFRDPIGHGGPHIQALAAYCNFAAIYRTSPAGLQTPGQGIDGAQEAILHELAWETVSKYAYAGVAANETGD